MVYDKLGRMTQRTEAEGTSTWTYDTKSKGIGKPAVVTAL
jgi:YD repeat-containing protein